MSDFDPSVSGFLGRLNQGLAKPNRYLVKFSMPQGIPASSAADGSTNALSVSGVIQAMGSVLNENNKVNVFCHSCSLPQRSTLVYTHKQFVGPYRVPYSQSYDPITFGFYADNHINTRRYFDIWQGAVVNIGSNTLNYYDEFVADMEILVLNEEGNFTYGVSIYEAWPMNVGMVDLGYGQTNNFMTVNVTMSYKYWQEKGSHTTARGA